MSHDNDRIICESPTTQLLSLLHERFNSRRYRTGNFGRTIIFLLMHFLLVINRC